MTNQHFKYEINEGVFIENRHSLLWLNHNKQFKNAALSEQRLYILDRGYNIKKEPVYTLCFFPLSVLDHEHDNNLQYVLKEIMCTKDRKTGKYRVSDYFNALKRSEHFLLTEVEEKWIIRSF